MKNIFFICFCALFAFSGCADDDDDLLTGGNVDIDLLPDAKPNDVVDPQVFEAINLNYPGLEKVKEFYEAGEHYYAANALLEYYRTRTNVTNPNLSLINVTISEAEQAKADYALVDYRFHVNNFYEDKETLKPYSVKQDGGINWEYSPKDASDEYQKQLHRHQWFIPQAKAYRVIRSLQQDLILPHGGSYRYLPVSVTKYNCLNTSRTLLILLRNGFLHSW